MRLTSKCTYHIFGVVTAVLLMLCLMGACTQSAFASEAVGGGTVTTGSNSHIIWDESGSGDNWVKQTTGGSTDGNGGGKTVDSFWDTISDDGTSVDGATSDVDIDSAADKSLGGLQDTYQEAMNQVQSALRIVKVCNIITACLAIGFLVALFMAIATAAIKRTFPTWPVIAMAGFLVLAAIFGFIIPHVLQNHLTNYVTGLGIETYKDLLF